ncbi:hypothetical protein VYA_27690 [Vibrio alfacsensis]|nr:hypothetical protein VYA_27690 [Vibrio alfacsensis]
MTRRALAFMLTLKCKDETERLSRDLKKWESVFDPFPKQYKRNRSRLVSKQLKHLNGINKPDSPFYRYTKFSNAFRY